MIFNKIIPYHLTDVREHLIILKIWGSTIKSRVQAWGLINGQFHLLPMIYVTTFLGFLKSRPRPVSNLFWGKLFIFGHKIWGLYPRFYGTKMYQMIKVEHN
jgi:hypothetical protein